MNGNSMARGTLLVIFVCFFLSGVAGLVYQVAWSKALGLIFGHTVHAIATVLAVFMGGLALGSVWLGGWCERHQRPVALYGWLELGIAAGGALSVAGLAAVRTLYVAAFPAFADSPVALLALRFAGAAAVLLLPTFLMGGTLPVLVRGLARTKAALGPRVSRLYWVNTAGAVAGTLAAGFGLLPALGLRRTVAVAVALNTLAGIAALLLSRWFLARRSQPAATLASETRQEPGTTRRLAQLLLAGFALVGATAMVYEIGWTRLLATMLGSSTYAFTLMLATFLLGIALGSRLFELWLARGHQVSLGTFAATQTLTAIAALAFLVFFQQLPRVVPPILRATNESFTGLILAQFVTSALAMLPAAIIFGFNFPLVTLLFVPHSEVSSGYAAAVGRAYAANTLGAIAGAVATGFWLVPRFGSFRVLALAAAANLLLAAALELRHSPRRPLVFAANLFLVAAALTVGWSKAFYNQALATFGTVLYWDLYEGKLTLAETAATTDIIFAEDGLNASISVARTEDYLALRTNGKVDASNHDATTQLLVGHLGAIFHPAPRRVLLIGFGSGMTVSAVARYPEVERIDCVEIEPAVIRAAAYLEPLNRRVLRDPRLRVILDDARNFLLTTREQYDLIISEPSNPWIAGVAALFTEEYYRAARGRLAPGGVFVQWVQAYSLYPEDLRMVLATFVSQFSRPMLWNGDLPDLLLLARRDDALLDLNRLRALWSNPALREDYDRLDLNQPQGLLAFFLLDEADLRRLAATASHNTDDHTRLEYRAPRALLARKLEDTNRQMIWEHRSSLLPKDLRIDDSDAALRAAAVTSFARDALDDVARFLERIPKEPPRAAVELLRGRLALARHLLPQARVALETALQLDPSSLAAAHGLAELARRRGDNSTAELLLRQILAHDSKYAPALELLVEIDRERKAWRQAVAWQRARMSAEPAPAPEDFCRLGELLSELEDRAGAQQHFQTALEHEPYSYCAHRQLGELYAAQELWPQARTHLEFVIQYFPDTDASTYAALAKVHRAIGDTRAADRTLRKGRRIFPQNLQLRDTTGIN